MKPTNTPHDHEFKTRAEGVSECYCGYSKMPHEVFQKRRRVWQEYYINVWKNATSVKRFRAQLKAHNEQNYPLVREFGLKAKEQLKSNKWEIPQPPYRDPMELDIRRQLWVI